MDRRPATDEQVSRADKMRETQILIRFWTAALLSVPLFLASDFREYISSEDVFAIPFVRYAALLIGTLVFFYCGSPFIRQAIAELRGRRPGMMMLVSVATSAAYVFSVYATLQGQIHSLFFELASLIAIMLFGHLVEVRALRNANGAFREFSRLLPEIAELVDGANTRTVPIAELRKGDVVLVRPGSTIPVDGVVIEGESEINESIITGESRSIFKGPGRDVVAGTSNGDGLLKVRVVHIGEKTFLSGVVRLVHEAQTTKSRLQTVADRAAFWLTLVAASVGAFSFVVWAVLSSVPVAFERLVAVLVVASPHALLLSVPLVTSFSVALAMKHGFLIRERRAFEMARNVDVVVFDKTGTLTRGVFGLSGIFSEDEHKTMQYAASIDQYSEHAVARAIVQEAKKRGIALVPVGNFTRIPGQGAKGKIKGVEVAVGNEAMCDQLDLEIPLKIRDRVRAFAREGKTIVYVFGNNFFVGALALADQIRPESYEAIEQLREHNVKTVMLTGDSTDVARSVSNELKIDIYFSEIFPDAKVERIKFFQDTGLTVAMVGDGINDAPALAQADVGIAIGAGTNIAIQSAGIILVKGDPRDISKVITLARISYQRMIQNIILATAYIALALPLAAGAFAYPLGWSLRPELAAALASFATIAVAINSYRLRATRTVLP